jgi:hypothetical protein
MRVIGRVATVAVVLAVSLGVTASAWADPQGPRSAAGAPSGAQAARVEQARAQALDDAYQAVLPRYGTGSGEGAARPRRLGGGELADDDGDRRAILDARDHGSGGAVSSLVSLLMWGMVIVLGVLIAFWLVSELSRYGGDAELPADASQVRLRAAAAAVIERPLEDADDLARRGQFAEAIHTLLLRTLQELVRSAAVRVAPATTSREVLAKVPLLADARSALAGLITAVELTHFGDEPASAADYERCRQQFHVFAAAFRNAGPSPPSRSAGHPVEAA